jgi:hypothetical protein
VRLCVAILSRLGPRVTWNATDAADGSTSLPGALGATVPSTPAITGVATTATVAAVPPSASPTAKANCTKFPNCPFGQKCHFAHPLCVLISSFSRLTRPYVNLLSKLQYPVQVWHVLQEYGVQLPTRQGVAAAAVAKRGRRLVQVFPQLHQQTLPVPSSYLPLRRRVPQQGNLCLHAPRTSRQH